MTQDALVPMGKLAKVYRKIRLRQAALTREYEDAMAVLESQRAQVGGAMKDQMLALDSTSLNTPQGMVILSKKTRYWASDWDAMYRFMVKNDCPYLLEKRIAQKAMAEYLADHPEMLPGGLNSETAFQISVRNPT